MNLPNEGMPQVVVVNRDEYVISYSQQGPCTFVHVHCAKWSPDIQKKLSDDIDVAFYLHGGPVYAIAHTEKHRKFDAMFGFKPTGVALDGGEVLIKEE